MPEELYDEPAAVTTAIPAIVYAAKSTLDPRGSIETQIEDCLAAVEREGRLLYGEAQRDEGFSAYHASRGPGLAEAKRLAVEAAREHGCAELWVQHSDRLARGDGLRAAHVGEIYFEMRRQQVRLRSVQDDSNFEDVIRAVLIGERNTEDSRRKSEATKAGMRRRAQRGKPNGGPAPYGYAWRQGTLVPVEHEARIVERIFRQSIGGRSQRQIARDLAREGVPAKRTAWHQGTVSQILRNPIYVGRLRLHGEEFPAEHEPLVSETLWQEATQQREATARTKGGGRGRPSSGTHLFTGGMLHCGRCGGSMVPRTIRPRSANGKPYEVYLCYTRIRDREACTQPPVARELVDEAALDYFERVCFDLDATLEQLRGSLAAEQATIRALREQAERELLRVDGSRERIERDYLAGDLTAESYEQLRSRLEDERASAQAEAERLRIREAEASIDTALDELTREALAEIAELREAIAARIREAEGIAAVRAVLLRLFERFDLVHVPTERAKLHHPAAELPAAELAERIAGRYGLALGEYWLEPLERGDLVLRIEDDWPVVPRMPLELAANNDGDGFAR
jgi:DNA invertase Pin-like site-specific DNA recombinase